MSIPHIAIQRHDMALYEWTILYGPEKADEDVGEYSISGWLTSALGSISESESLVEISYRGMHMGTFLTADIRKYPETVSKRINDAYASLVN